MYNTNERFRQSRKSKLVARRNEIQFIICVEHTAPSVPTGAIATPTILREMPNKYVLNITCATLVKSNTVT